MEKTMLVDQVERVVLDKLDKARTEGKKSIIISSKEIAEEMGIENGYNAICTAMKRCITTWDKVLKGSKDKSSNTFTVEYKFIDNI